MYEGANQLVISDPAPVSPATRAAVEKWLREAREVRPVATPEQRANNARFRTLCARYRGRPSSLRA